MLSIGSLQDERARLVWNLSDPAAMQCYYFTSPSSKKKKNSSMDCFQLKCDPSSSIFSGKKGRSYSHCLLVTESYCKQGGRRDNGSFIWMGPQQRTKMEKDICAFLPTSFGKNLVGIDWFWKGTPPPAPPPPFKTSPTGSFLDGYVKQIQHIWKELHLARV